MGERLPGRRVTIRKHRQFTRSIASRRRRWCSTRIAEVARDLGINEGTLGNWVTKYRDEHLASEELDLPGRAGPQVAEPLARRSDWHSLVDCASVGRRASLRGPEPQILRGTRTSQNEGYTGPGLSNLLALRTLRRSLEAERNGYAGRGDPGVRVAFYIGQPCLSRGYSDWPGPLSLDTTFT
jgi:transposase-like protein